MDCLFCRIASGEVPADVVDRGENVVVFRDISPQAPIHLLAIPRRHVASAADLGDNDGPLLTELFAALQSAARSEGATSYRIITNIGPDAGQSVLHLHLHLLAGRPLKWPPG